jgi:hypothetical protein
MSRTIAALLGAALLAAGALAAPAHAAKAADDACTQNSPNASVCIGMDKLAEGAATECRKAGAPDDSCVAPAGHDNLAAERAAYASSWVHRAAQFQYRLGNSVPLRDAQWLGTHNSFNSFANGETPSHLDSNQQLTLSQQLDIDIRALEIDVHWVPSPQAGGQNAVVVCHGRGPDEEDAGCTNEPLLPAVLPEIADWLNAHPDDVLLLYLEDNLGDPQGYADTVAQLEAGLKRPDGSSLIFHPDPAATNAKGCTDLPLGTSRDAVRAASAQVVMVGNCRSGWASDVFGWDDNHVESGSTPGFQSYPACDATYGPDVYATKLVRYFEDSTYVSAAVDPSETPGDHAAGALSPDKVAAMVRCGVNLFGFDQILPSDGRLEASIWSWAADQPDTSAGSCTTQGEDGRWTTGSCRAQHPAACRTADGGWVVTPRSQTESASAKACRRLGAQLGLPRTGQENSDLRAAAGTRTVWLDYRAS